MPTIARPGAFADEAEVARWELETRGGNERADSRQPIPL